MEKFFNLGFFRRCIICDTLYSRHPDTEEERDSVCDVCNQVIDVTKSEYDPVDKHEETEYNNPLGKES